MEKVAPSERFRSELDEVLAGVGEEHDPIETVGRLGARLILQQALEDEVTEFLGRTRYERTEKMVSHRNGHEPRTVKTTSGALALERPRVRNASKLGFESRILGKGVARTHARGWPRPGSATRKLRRTQRPSYTHRPPNRRTAPSARQLGLLTAAGRRIASGWRRS
jgi:Transposase, Mutator family